MDELLLQDKYLITFLTQRIDGLGYKEVKANTVTAAQLLIEEDLLHFVSQTSQNKDNWKKLLQSYQQDEAALFQDFIDFLLDRMKDSTNMAIFFNNNKSVTFKGVSIYLFYPSGSKVYGDKLFEENIFSVVQEMPYSYKHGKIKQYSIRPDITFFLNGIYLGYTELKSNYNNQNAQKDGRAKVITNYETAVERYLKLADKNDKNESIKKEMLKFFHKAIHITTTDIQDTFVIRTIAKHFDAIRHPSTQIGERYQDVVTKDFKPYPLRRPAQHYRDRVERFEEVFRALYSKKMIEREILYYNFIEREIEKDSKGRKKYHHTRGRLIAPRPKQKFGADKILDKIDEFLLHEHDDDYFLNKLKRQFKEKGIGTVQANELIEKRLKYKNNKNVYSLLLQYAAGFGKSNIIGWTALQLKDLQRKNDYVYDKIMLVVDRVQLRDQLDTKLFNMNIHKKMFIEARSQSEFKKALSTDTRIIVVNLQKFNTIRDLLTEDVMGNLVGMRVAFLIDEIHRSHSNIQHQEMMGLFDELQNAFDTSPTYQQDHQKKNLIIGFTATPTEYALSRFGEFDIYAESQQIMVPFDSYTMEQAILDGYILNPLSGLVPVASKMYYEIPQDPTEGWHDNEQEYTIRKKKIYENQERLEAIAQFVVDRLLAAVYPNIGGRAKAMLAVSSIPIAIQYYKAIKKYYPQAVGSKKKYERFQDAPIFIVYSDSQKYPKASSFNEDKTEAKVLQEFELKKNGLIIVVDKLQTGFDEPLLHTLFLDKEIKGINAIQTISRVNRTTKGKNDCKVVDFSHKNVNINNIKAAIEKYYKTIVSDFDPLQHEAVLASLYTQLSEHELYTQHFADFVAANEDPKHAIDLLQIEAAFSNYIRQQEAPAEALKKNINLYYRTLHLIEFLIELEDQYNEAHFLNFWKRYNNIYNTLRPTGNDKDDVLTYYDYKTGIVAPPEERNASGGSGSGGGSTGVALLRGAARPPISTNW